MPSTHAPIKKYNYERSLFRWVMSRHPEPFEKHGITTRTLERAPLAREAFYTSDWPGARSLVQSTAENKYERTAFFDGIIERGLRDGTRFNIDHVTAEEKQKLGITMDRATGKFFLAAYGSAKTRRNSTRRGSLTSSDGDATDQHAVIKEVRDLLVAEIEAAGEHAEVHLSKTRTDQSSVRGPRIINFSVSILRRTPVGAVVGDLASRRGGGEGVGPAMAHTQPADAGGGKPAPVLRRRGSTSSIASDAGMRHTRDGSSPKQLTIRRESSAPAPLESKPRGRPISSLSDGGCGASDVRGPGFSVLGAPKRRRSLTHAVFSPSPAIGATGVAKQEPHQGGSSNLAVDVRFSRPSSAESRSRNVAHTAGNAQSMSFLPGRATMAQQSQQHQLPASPPVAQYGTAAPARTQGFSSGRGFTGLGGNFGQVTGMTTDNGTHAPSTGGCNSGRGSAATMSSAPSTSSWPTHRAMMRSDDFGPQGSPRTTMGRGVEIGGVEACNSSTTTTTTTAAMTGSMPTLLHQHQLSGSTTFGHRTPDQTATIFGSDSHTAISNLNAYSARVKQQSLSHGMSGNNSHGGWGATTRVANSMACGKEPDEEDIDFLAAFF